MKKSKNFLESISLEEKIKTLENIISFYLYEVNFNNQDNTIKV